MSISKFPGGLITKNPVTPSGPYETSTAPGVWTMTQVANYVKQGLWPTAGSPVPDPYFEYVTMLLHGDGTNGGQNNTFLDSSTNNFTITRNGNTTQGSFSPYGSLWSNYALDTSTNNGLSWTFNGSPAQTAVGGTNYTIEFWLNRATRSGSYQSMFSTEGDRNNFIVDPSDNLLITSNGGTSMFTVAANTYIPVGVWTHVALVCSDTTWTLYFNGVSYGTYSGASKTNGPVGNAWLVGRNDMNGCGYMSNFRISTVARYSGNFTPSTTPFTTDASTAMLACQSNRFVDVSANAQTLTRNGSTSVTNFAPFNPTAAYSTATNGGSGYFDGSGDYLTAANATALNVDAGDLTVEAWIYITGDITGVQPVLAKGFGSAGGWMLWVQNTLRLRMYDGAGASVTATSSATLVPNSWNHVAGTRSGNTLTVWVNGVSSGTATFTGTSTNSSSLEVGGYNTATSVITGYISSARLVKGTAVYTGNFTPPSSPLTAVSGTSLLLGFTNGAIFDNSMKNNLETVGNAQISTSVVKFGTGSISIPGGGANAFIPSSPNLDMGTGAFTVECWVNSTSIAAAYPTFISSVTGWSAGSSGHRFNNSGAANKFTFHLNGAGDPFLTSGNTFSFGVWYHYALTRSGDTWRMFINGNLEASGTYSAAFNQALGGIRLGYAQWDGANGYYNGYIDDLRITKGVARYTANFTPPTQAFPNV